MRVRAPVFLSLSGAVLAALVLVGCASTSGGPAPVAAGVPPPPKTGLFSGMFGNDANKNLVTVQNEDTISTEMFLSQGYCPPVEIRAGTEALVVYEKGHEEDQNFIRFQGSITQTARECHVLGPDQLAIKVGIAGRIAAGPKGTAGAVNATLRVVVVKQHGGTVFYSEAIKATTTVAPPTYAGDFTQVVDNITLTLGQGDRDLIIYVGYDEGKPKPKT